MSVDELQELRKRVAEQNKEIKTLRKFRSVVLGELQVARTAAKLSAIVLFGPNLTRIDPGVDAVSD